MRTAARVSRERREKVATPAPSAFGRSPAIAFVLVVVGMLAMIVLLVVAFPTLLDLIADTWSGLPALGADS